MGKRSLERYFPWLSAGQAGELERLVWIRAADGFERGRLWRDAAQCWLQAGNLARAGELYRQSGDLRQAAALRQAQGQYAAALELYAEWGATRLPGDSLGRLEALLCQSACHLLGARAGQAGLGAAEGQSIYRQARALATEIGPDNRAAWLLLAGYGHQCGRYDLVEAGCAQALALAQTEAERIEALRAWQAGAQQQGDRSQARRLAEDLAELGAWEGHSL